MVKAPSLMTVAARPCGSCPYRRDVPSGVWEPAEYAKLLDYDKETWAQPVGVFMCHQRDGCLCAGWLACHGNELLSLRLLAHKIDPDAFAYKTDVPVFASGAEAAAHGLRDINRPSAKARKLMAKLDPLMGSAS